MLRTAAVRRFPREALVLRIVSVLNALAALGNQARNLSVDFAQILPLDARGKLLSALSSIDLAEIARRQTKFIAGDGDADSWRHRRGELTSLGSPL